VGRILISWYKSRLGERLRETGSAVGSSERATSASRGIGENLEKIVRFARHTAECPLLPHVRCQTEEVTDASNANSFPILRQNQPCPDFWNSFGSLESQ
jgi:hypothetical protein